MNAIPKIKSTALFLALIGMAALLVACGGGSGDGSSTSANGGTGTLAVSLQDAPSGDYKAVYVTIQEVQVHHDNTGEWETLSTPNKTYNLLDLQYGVREELGIADLDTGYYTQMRLILGNVPDGSINILSKPHPYPNYAITFDDIEHELKVPSGYQTGIKIVKGFYINANETTEIILDFDAHRSVVVAGKSGKWLLKPTIKVLEEKNYAIVQGRVTTDSGKGVENALVSLQIYNSDTSASAEDRVTVQTSTYSDASGDYMLFVEPGTYNLVAYKDNYQPVCAIVSPSSGEVYDANDLVLSEEAAAGGLKGSVEIGGPDQDEEWLTISIQKLADCGAGDVWIEVLSFNYADQASVDETLSSGIYDLVLSSYIIESEVVPDITIVDAATTDVGTLP